MKKTHDYIYHYRGYWSDGGKCRIRKHHLTCHQRALTSIRRSSQAGSLVMASLFWPAKHLSP
jgi:hypothetical protein